MKKIFLVYPGNGVWAVESISGRGAAWRFSTQYAAVCFARQLARRARGELLVCGRDGKPRLRHRYFSWPAIRR